MDTQSIAFIAMAAVTAAAVVGWVIRKKNAIDDVQKKIIRAVGVFKKYGWDRTADIGVDLGAGDASDAIKKFLALAEEMTDPEQAVALITGSAFKALPAMLNDDGTRVKLFKAVEKWKLANPELPKPTVETPTAVPSATTPAV